MLKVAHIAVGLVLFGAVGAAHGQKVVRAQVSEDFAPSVRVSGNVLVGVVIGSPAGKADPRKLVVPSASAMSGKPLCFTAKTRDGQYLAEARLPQNIVPPDDFTIEPEGQWKHLAALSAYASADFAPLVRVGEDCALNPKAPVTPMRYADGGATTLTVFINSQRSLSASVSLKWADGRSKEGVCNTVEASRVRSAAFDMVCSVSLPPAPQGAVTLSVVRRARMGPATDTFSLSLPVAPARPAGN